MLLSPYANTQIQRVNFFENSLIEIDMKYAAWFSSRRDTVFNHVAVHMNKANELQVSYCELDNLSDAIRLDVYDIVRKLFMVRS